MTLDPDAIAGAFVDFARGSSTALFDLIADDCIDHVSGRTGKDIWATVSDWLQESFADIEVELHAVGTADHERVMIWIHCPRERTSVAHSRWMRGRPASGRRVSWKQLHVFARPRGPSSSTGLFVMTYAVLEAIDQT